MYSNCVLLLSSGTSKPRVQPAAQRRLRRHGGAALAAVAVADTAPQLRRQRAVLLPPIPECRRAGRAMAMARDGATTTVLEGVGAGLRAGGEEGLWPPDRTAGAGPRSSHRLPPTGNNNKATAFLFAGLCNLFTKYVQMV